MISSKLKWSIYGLIQVLSFIGTILVLKYISKHEPLVNIFAVVGLYILELLIIDYLFEEHNGN